jgi:hypothetical protein
MKHIYNNNILIIRTTYLELILEIIKHMQSYKERTFWPKSFQRFSSPVKSLSVYIDLCCWTTYFYYQHLQHNDCRPGNVQWGNRHDDLGGPQRYITLPFTSGSSERTLSVISSNQNPVSISHNFHTCYVPNLSQFLYFVALILSHPAANFPPNSIFSNPMFPYLIEHNTVLLSSHLQTDWLND